MRRAYQELEQQIEFVEVRQTILAQVEQFTLGDLSAQLPSASSQLIKKVLAELKKAGKVRLTGRGRGARWDVVPPPQGATM